MPQLASITLALLLATADPAPKSTVDPASKTAVESAPKSAVDPAPKAEVELAPKAVVDPGRKATPANSTAKGIKTFVLPPYIPYPTGCPQLASACTALEARDVEKTLTLLRSASSEFPQLPPARVMLARMLFATGQIATARQALDSAAVEEGDHPEVYFLFAQIALAEGRLTESNVLLEKAGVLSVPKSWSSEIKNRFQGQLAAGRASIAERRRDWPVAQNELSNWIKLDPTSGVAHQRLGIAIYYGESPDTKKLDTRDVKVLKLFMRASELDATLEPPEVTLAWLYAGSGNNERAGYFLKDGVSRHPQDPRTQFRYGAWLLGQGDTSEAMRHLDSAAKLGYSSDEFHVTRGLAFRQVGDLSQAEMVFESLHRQSPGEFEPANQLALVLAEQELPEKQERALKIASATTRQYPQSAEALATLGWIHYRQGRKGQAEQLLRTAASGGGIRSESAYYLARVLVEKGPSDDANRAIQALNRAVATPGQFVLRFEAKKWLQSVASQKKQAGDPKSPNAGDLE